MARRSMSIDCATPRGSCPDGNKLDIAGHHDAEGRMSGLPENSGATATPGTDVSVSLRKLVLIRWIAVIGQAATLLVIYYGLGFALPIKSALAVVAASAVLNAVAS